MTEEIIDKEVIEETDEKIELKTVEITSIETKIIGDRVCVDLVTDFQEGEGCLIGACSKGLFLMHSETRANQWVPPRSFRVNAGALSMYIRVSDGKTKYLSELKGGSSVLAVNHNGETKNVTVARSKTESRPLLMITAKYIKKDKKPMDFHTFVQNAETIALVDEEGMAISVTQLKIGDRVRASVDNPRLIGRHMGTEAEEFIYEK